MEKRKVCKSCGGKSEEVMVLEYDSKGLFEKSEIKMNVCYGCFDKFNKKIKSSGGRDAKKWFKGGVVFRWIDGETKIAVLDNTWAELEYGFTNSVNCNEEWGGLWGWFLDKHGSFKKDSFVGIREGREVLEIIENKKGIGELKELKKVFSIDDNNLRPSKDKLEEAKERASKTRGKPLSDEENSRVKVKVKQVMYSEGQLLRKVKKIS